MPRSSERGAVRRRLLFAMVAGMPVVAAGIGPRVRGTGPERRVTAPNPGRDPAGGHSPPAGADRAPGPRPASHLSWAVSPWCWRRLPAALPERGLRIAALQRVRSRRSREHCPSGLGFYGVNPRWPGNVLHV
jgi:hypothetical protein